MRQDVKERIPLYNHANLLIGEISIEDALAHRDEGEMTLTSKGRGRKFRYTSAHWLPRPNLHWRVLPSAGFHVLQLVDT